jgi:transposase InsO family protein
MAYEFMREYRDQYGIREMTKVFGVSTDAYYKWAKQGPSQRRSAEDAALPGLIRDGWLYLTVVLDLYDRKVIGRAFSDGLETARTTIPAVRMAFASRTARDGLVFHFAFGS